MLGSWGSKQAADLCVDDMVHRAGSGDTIYDIIAIRSHVGLTGMAIICCLREKFEEKYEIEVYHSEEYVSVHRPLP